MNEHPPRLAFSATNRDAWLAWRQEFRDKLYELLAPWSQPVDLAPEIVRMSDGGAHWREEIVLSSHANMEIPCLLLRPKEENGPRPTVLALHGHGEGATGAPKDHLTIHIYDGEHRYYGDGVGEFWNRYL